MSKFTEGHTLSRGKRKPGGGRKKLLSTLIKEATANNSQFLPEYFDRLRELALNGDREALLYLIDRHLGKPKASTEVELTGGESLGMGTISEIFKLVDQRRQELEDFKRKELSEGKDAVQE